MLYLEIILNQIIDFEETDSTEAEAEAEAEAEEFTEIVDK
jgi:hypothetical protein